MDTIQMGRLVTWESLTGLMAGWIVDAHDGIVTVVDGDGSESLVSVHRITYITFEE